MTDLTIDGKALREACEQFATGVTIITTPDDEEAHGMTANAFMSVSLDPPLIAISLNNAARMLSKIRRSGRYEVNILAEGMHDVALHFAGRHNPDLSALLAPRDGMPVVPGATV
ncbi:flavin reductase family protein [Celeribacter neptunius]|uniref:flavin reductase family protein n=1 Tax=Celeribacter neptunius TaxID=588602 RepID=UPI0026A57E9F